MSRNNFFLSSSSPQTNYSLVNRHIAQKEKAPRDRRLCSSQKPWDFFDSIGYPVFTDLLLISPQNRRGLVFQLGSVQCAGLCLLSGMGNGFDP